MPKDIYTYLLKVWDYKRITITLAKRDLKKQYAQTFLGVFWSALQPMLGLAVFTLFFAYIFKIDTQGLPYPLIALTGILPWFYFVGVASTAGNSLIENQDIVKRVYFPRILLPVSKSLSLLSDFGIGFIVYTLLAILYMQPPALNALLLPVFLLMLILLSLTIGIWLSALSIRYRDLQSLVPYLLNLSIWVTPVFYPVSSIPQAVKPFLYLNPMAGIIEGIRYCLLGTETWQWAYLYPWPFVIIAFIGGVSYFRRTETIVSDYL